MNESETYTIMLGGKAHIVRTARPYMPGRGGATQDTVAIMSARDRHSGHIGLFGRHKTLSTAQRQRLSDDTDLIAPADRYVRGPRL